MRTCQKCGAALAEHAQYCMQCGTAANGVAPGSTPLAATAFVGPAFLSGTIVGILGSIPVVNCLCCAWMLGGGALSAWLTGRNTAGGPQALTIGDGAFAGVLAGVWAAILATLASIPLRMLSAEAIADQRDELEAMLSQYPEIAGPVREALMSLVSDNLSALTVLFTLVSNVLFYGLFAMIGGILLVAIVRKPALRH